MKNTFQSISPVDGSIYVERSYTETPEIEKVLSRSVKAQKVWAKTSISHKSKICLRAIRYFQENAEPIAREITWQMGRPIRYTPFEIKNGLKERAEYMIEIAENALRDVPVENIGGFKRFIRKEPLGVVFVLAPWNYPYLTSINAIIPSLMAGNCIILKHATQTPLCAERYAEAFVWAGLPEGVFQYLHLSHQQVQKVIADNTIAYVAFTGSVEGGNAIQKAVNNRFISAGLELGGKDPAYVCTDADIPFAIENLVDGSFFNSGQSCCGIERIYVDENIFDEFVDGFVSLTRSYVVGNPTRPETTLGPLVRKSAVEHALGQVNEACRKGAKPLIGKDDFPDLSSPYMPPQVLINVDHTMALMTEESFAPVIGIMSVKNEEDAIRLMNDSQYGLTASIWTRDIEKAITIGDRIETGTWFMNRCDYLDPALAWTGVKNSGKGCTLSSMGYDFLTAPKILSP